MSDSLDLARTALIAYDVRRPALTPADPARGQTMRPVRECCWSGDRQAHEYSLTTAVAMFSRVRTLAEVERMLGASPSMPV